MGYQHAMLRGIDVKEFWRECRYGWETGLSHGLWMEDGVFWWLNWTALFGMGNTEAGTSTVDDYMEGGR